MLLTPRWLGLEGNKALPKTPGDIPTPVLPKGAAERQTLATTKVRSAPSASKIESALAPDAAATDVVSASAASKGPGKKALKRLHQRNAANAKVKEPEEAADYLAGWQKKSVGDGSWKFNKATQAWLLRHAYKPSHVNKPTFELLLLYLAGLKGVACDRARTEADAIVLLRGAPLKSETEEADPDAGADEDQQAVGSGENAEEKDKEQTIKISAADAAAKAEADAAAKAEQAKEDAKTRKMRVRRAKQILGVLNGDAPQTDTADCAEERQTSKKQKTK